MYLTSNTDGWTTEVDEAGTNLGGWTTEEEPLSTNPNPILLDTDFWTFSIPSGGGGGFANP